ncbi:MAG: DegV family protein [Pseudomonadota bacterium]
MDPELKAAFVTGYERMAAWSDLLDDINLYPVADADTGRNLRISLAPLKTPDHNATARRLLLSATGNSGNIAGAFFSKFTAIETPEGLGLAARAGKESAWQSLLTPKPGTMLSVFDALAETLDPSLPPIHTDSGVSRVMETLKTAVLKTAEILPELKQADVVDAGALGMFIFFEGFLNHLIHRTNTFCSPKELFGSRLTVSGPLPAPAAEAYCIDTVIQPAEDPRETARKIATFGHQVVTVSNGDRMKIHLHAPDAAVARQALASMGTVVRWNMEKIEVKIPNPPPAGQTGNPVHIVTDAAGSLTREAARDLGITLFESYILMGDRSIPETLVSPHELYTAMRQGVKVTTAQASTFERHQYYESALHRHEKVVYLCVGSVYTGNYDVARHWAAGNPAGHRFTVIDTAAAAGKLGLLARRVAKAAVSGKDLPAIIQYATAISPVCEEIIFLDQLKYLAAGGRISRTRGFLGDLFNVKPVISPTAAGVKKIGVVKNREEQLIFAVKHLEKRLSPKIPAEILLTHTDNEEWVSAHARPWIQSLLPLSEISLAPLSLTSGVHMGPGTWAVAFLPRRATVSGADAP